MTICHSVNAWLTSKRQDLGRFPLTPGIQRLVLKNMFFGPLRHLAEVPRVPQVGPQWYGLKGQWLCRVLPQWHGWLSPLARIGGLRWTFSWLLFSRLRFLTGRQIWWISEGKFGEVHRLATAGERRYRSPIASTPRGYVALNLGCLHGHERAGGKRSSPLIASPEGVRVSVRFSS